MATTEEGSLVEMVVVKCVLVVEMTGTTVETVVETAAVTCGITETVVDKNAQPVDSTTNGTIEDHGTSSEHQWAAETNDQVDSEIDQPGETDHPNPGLETETVDDEHQWVLTIDHLDSVIGQEAAKTPLFEETMARFEVVPAHEARLETSDLTMFEVAAETVQPVDSVIGQEAATMITCDVISTEAEIDQFEEVWIPEAVWIPELVWIPEARETTHHVTPLRVTMHQEGDDSLVKNQRNLGQHHLLNNQLKNKAHQHQPQVHLTAKGVLMLAMDGLKFKCDKNWIKNDKTPNHRSM